MIKPKRLSHAKRRKMIVKAAIDVIAESNYRAATMADIAEKAGVSAPMIYNFFKSKKELFIEILNLTGGASFQKFRLEQTQSVNVIKNKAEFRAIIENTLFPYFRSMEKYQAELKVFYQASSEIDDEDVKRVIKNAYTNTANFYKTLFQRAVSQGILQSNLDTEAVAYDFLGFIIQQNALFLAGIYDEDRMKYLLDVKINSWSDVSGNNGTGSALRK